MVHNLKKKKLFISHQKNIFKNRGQQQGNQELPRTIGGLINMNQTSDLTQYYPMSLKNLCRIKIKESMIDYTLVNVEQLSILPSVLKSFMMFEDEIEAIIKCSKA